jgi:hypothetical protein
MKTLFKLEPVKRKSRVKRAGSRTSRPTWSFDFSEQNSFSREACLDWNVDEISNQALRVDLAAFTSFAARSLTPEEVDWLMFAIYAYSADRFSSRMSKTEAGASLWRRQIRMKIPVADITRWNDAKPSILSALLFLTDDDWDLEFVQRRYLVQEQQQAYFPSCKREFPNWVCLFSGGLDSLAGAVDLIRSINKNGLLVSGWTHNRLHTSQAEVVAKLNGTIGGGLTWLPAGYGFPQIINNDFMESSQRCRGWIHVAMGLAAANISNLDTLDVCENGIGAFNLPTELSQTGSHTSRSVHPVFLHRIAIAAEMILGQRFGIRQNAVFETKGQLLQRTLGNEDTDLISSTFSCEIFPNYHSNQHQCGVCPSCLVRRTSLHAAGIADDGGEYTWDVLGKEVPLKKNLGLIKMEAYARRLNHRLQPGAPVDCLLWEYPEAASFFKEAAGALSISDDDFLGNFSQLHYDFIREWNNFAQSIQGLRQAKEIAA